MTKFVQTIAGTYINLACVATVKPVAGKTDTLRVTTRDDCGYEVEIDRWKQAIGDEAIAAAPGIRIIEAGRYLKSPIIGCTVLAWRLGGYDEYPSGVALDATGEDRDNPEDIAYLFPDGRVENCEGCWPSMEDFAAHHAERHAKWQNETRARYAKAQAAE